MEERTRDGIGKRYNCPLILRDMIAHQIDMSGEAITTWETIREFLPDPRSGESPLAEALSDLANLPTTRQAFESMCVANGWWCIESPKDMLERKVRIYGDEICLK